MTRTRTNVHPQYGGVACPPSFASRQCNDFACPVDCLVEAWSEWSSCTESCGTGAQRRTRQTTAPSNGGAACPQDIHYRSCNHHACPLDCVVGEWSQYGECTHTCGGGSQTRTRSLTQPAFGGAACPASSSEQDCNTHSCPVDCVVGAWQSWGDCSASCWTGTQTRIRTFTQPSFGGALCPTSEDSRQCNTHACPIDCIEGEWSHDATTATCSVSCGAGTYTKTRTLTQPQYGGRACGPSSEVVNCNHGDCPVHCSVGEWSAWDACTESCGTGSQTRTRDVTVDFKDGYTCSLSSPDCHLDGVQGHEVVAVTRCSILSDERDCNEHACPKDCVVGAWSDWSSCTLSCGTGSQTRPRVNTAPEHGGKACPSSRAQRACNDHECPVDCVYGDWSTWSSCSKSCGTGTQTRIRGMVRPFYGGAACVDSADQLSTSDSTGNAFTEVAQRNCNAHECPVDCVVGAWGAFGECSLSCASGSQTRTRSITQPQSGGKACPQASHVQTCNALACPVDCVVGGWSAWDECTHSCDGGSQTRTRSTTEPSFGGVACPDSSDVRQCNAHACAVDCVEGEWSHDDTTATCSVSCGSGTYTKTRTLTQPQNGGRECGPSSEVVGCNHGPCPVHCDVNDWADWSACSHSCGVGTQTRQRTIATAPVDGHSCPLSEPDCHRSGSHTVTSATTCPDLGMTRSCNEHNCAIDCVVGSWSTWSQCTQTCSTSLSVGSQTRTRQNTPPEHGGAACPVSSETTSCNDFNCPVDCKVGDWNSWDECSKTCGEDTQNRRRTLVYPSYGGAECPVAPDRLRVEAG